MLKIDLQLFNNGLNSILGHVEVMDTRLCQAVLVSSLLLKCLLLLVIMVLILQKAFLLDRDAQAIVVLIFLQKLLVIGIKGFMSVIA